MADKKISELPFGQLTSNSIIPIVTNGITSQITFGNILSHVSGGTGGEILWSAGTGTNSIVQNNSDSIANGINSFIVGSGNTTNSNYSVVMGVNSTANGFEIVPIKTQITVISAITVTTSDPNNSAASVVLSGNVFTEWNEYLWGSPYNIENLFNISDGNNNYIINGNNLWDIYYDIATDSTYIVDGDIPLTSYVTISGSPNLDIMTQFDRPAFVIGSNSLATGANSIVLGIDISGTSDNTTYVDYFNIKRFVNENVILGVNAGTTAATSYNSTFIGQYAGQNTTGSNNSNFIGQFAGNQSINGHNSNFIGQQSGENTTGAYMSNFLGYGAGRRAINAHNSNFLGANAGDGGEYANSSNFIGPLAGYLAINGYNSNFIGSLAGKSATNASYSNFFGQQAGNIATNASYSNFIGNGAGNGATNAHSSNFIGDGAGNFAANASYSNLFGLYVGLTFGTNSIGPNNIIIGTNISLPSGTTNSINLGGVLFGTGTYSTTTGNPSIVAQTNGKIGINVVNPTNTLHICSSSADTSGLRLERLTSSATTSIGQPIGVDASGNVVTISASTGATIANGFLRTSDNSPLTGTLKQISDNSGNTTTFWLSTNKMVNYGGNGSVTTNTAFGFDALNSNTTGQYNTGIGNNALSNNTTGSSNVSIGYLANRNGNNGSNSVSIGAQSMRNNSGGNNVAIGSSALFDNRGASNNVGVGFGALNLNQVGSGNTSVGTYTLFALDGSDNVALGYKAGATYSGGGSNYILTSSNGIFIGANSMSKKNNTLNEIVIGYNVIGNGSNTTVLGNSTISATTIYGIIYASGTTNALISGDTTGKSLITKEYLMANMSSGSSSPITVVNTSSLYSTAFSGTGLSASTGITNSIFLGQDAGFGTTFTSDSNFIGQSAGSGATNANNSNFIGNNAGYGATSAKHSNFFGSEAGRNATSAERSNFFGQRAGYGALNASYSNFFGAFAGYNVTTNANNSNLFGYNVGNATGIGSIGSNNIIIGTNISLPSGTTNSINLGGVLFGSGSYATTGGTASISAQTQGKIGINVVNPTEALDVSGKGQFTSSVKVGDNSDVASASNVGAIRYNVSGTTSNVDMCMQTGVSAYTWVNIVSNNW